MALDFETVRFLRWVFAVVGWNIPDLFKGRAQK